jgi:hypothetical protein
MKKILTGLAALAMTAVITTGDSTEAKADGGVVLGIGVYLLVDALVGRHCHRSEWPFNIARKVGDELHGKRGCRGAYRHQRHHAW